MKTLSDYPLADLSLVYRLLKSHVLEEQELLDSELLADLQVQLQACATRKGVDVSDHGQWDAWLGARAGATRPAGRSLPTA